MKKSHIFISTVLKNIILTGLAFICGYYFTTMFHEPSSLIGGLWALMSAVVVNEASHKETFSTAKNWMIGSIIGTLVSGSYLMLFSYSILGFVLTIGVGVCICLLLGIPKSIKVTVMSIAAVIVVATLSKDLHPYANAGLRLSESIIGTLIAMIVALIFYTLEKNLLTRIEK